MALWSDALYGEIFFSLHTILYIHIRGSSSVIESPEEIWEQDGIQRRTNDGRYEEGLSSPLAAPGLEDDSLAWLSIYSVEILICTFGRLILLDHQLQGEAFQRPRVVTEVAKLEWSHKLLLDPRSLEWPDETSEFASGLDLALA